ncbi:MAG: hypothetical protein HDS11_03340, partial [Bacteroides sp.]|nr:hypothetical protein [Bacteroides sp.]
MPFTTKNKLLSSKKVLLIETKLENMNFKHLFSGITVGLCLVTVSIPLVACAQKSDKQSTETTMSNDSRMKRGGGRPGGPQLGTPGGGPVIDKTGDETLQAMIKDELPLF